jgi:hypothetical protein
MIESSGNAGARTKLMHRDRLARLSDENKTLYEKLARLPIDELLCIRDELERIRVQEQCSKFKLIKGGRTAGNESAEDDQKKTL